MVWWLPYHHSFCAWMMDVCAPCDALEFSILAGVARCSHGKQIHDKHDSYVIIIIHVTVPYHSLCVRGLLLCHTSLCVLLPYDDRISSPFVWTLFTISPSLCLLPYDVLEVGCRHRSGASERYIPLQHCGWWYHTNIPYRH